MMQSWKDAIIEDVMKKNSMEVKIHQRLLENKQKKREDH